MMLAIRKVPNPKADGEPIWEVGMYEANDLGEIEAFHALATFATNSDAADYVHWLNGGLVASDISSLVHALELVAERLDRIWRSIGRCR
jgi:hypothetical protein